MAGKNPLAIALQDAMMQQPTTFAPLNLPQQQPAAPQRPTSGMSKGQIIAGILGDALAGVNGQPGRYAAMMAQRQAQMDADQRQEVNWGRRRQAEMEDWQTRQEIERRNPAPTAMERNLSTWQKWTPEQRQAYAQMQESAGNDFVTMTLPNGQFYAGPKSGIVAALGGLTAPQPQGPQPSLPTSPVGKLTPVPDGGPTPPASGGFPRPY